MVKQYGELYLDARRALLETEDTQTAGMMARHLLCKISGKTQESILADRDLYASEETCRQMHAAVRRLLDGEPLAYVLGEWEFYGLNPSGEGALSVTASPCHLSQRERQERGAEIIDLGAFL